MPELPPQAATAKAGAPNAPQPLGAHADRLAAQIGTALQDLAVIVVDLSGPEAMIVSATRSAGALLGHASEDLAGQSPRDLLYAVGTDHAALYEARQRANAAGFAMVRAKLRLGAAGDRETDVAIIPVGPPDAPNAHVAYILQPVETGGSVQLIARAEAAASMGCWRVSFKDGAQQWSDHLYELMGVRPGAPLPDWREHGFVSSADADRLDAEFERLAREGGAFDLTVTIHRPDGGKRVALVSGEAERDPSGVVYSAVGVLIDITAFAAAEHAARDADRRYRRTMAVIGVGLVSVDLKSLQVGVNDDAAALLGFHAGGWSEPLAGFLDRIHPDDREAAKAAYDQIITADVDVTSVEVRMLTQDQVHVWRELRVSVERDARGTPIELMCVMLDVEERRQQADDLNTARAQLDIVVRKANIGILTWDLRTGRTRMSQELVELLGLPPHAPMTWREFEDHLHPKEHDAVTGAIFGAIDLETDDSFEFDHQLRGPDGAYLWVTTAGAIVRQNEQPVQVIAAIRDISERKTALFDLMENEARLHDVMACVGEAVVELDASGRVTYASEKTRAVIGADPETAISRRALAFVTIADVADRAALRQALSERDFHDLIVGVGDTEARRYLRLNGRRLVNAQDGHGGWRIAVSDVTERVEGEHKLRDATRLAEQSMQAKSRFLATMTHEIRTPLNAMIGMTDLLQDAELSDENTELLNAANEAARHLLTLVNDVLDFSKLDAGAMTLESAPFSPADLVRRTTSLFVTQAGEKNLTINTVVSPSAEEMALGDASRLRQMLMNLIGNAVKFTASGRIDVCVDLGPVDPAAGYPVGSNSASGPNPGARELFIAVRDTGQGIPAAALPSLFDPFVQAGGDTQAGGPGGAGGTGLGLSISRELIDLMGGMLTVESELGVGSTFQIHVPLSCATAQAPASSTGSATPGADNQLPTSNRRAPARSLRILVAEDNQANQLLMRTLLARLGHAAEFVDDGVAAVAAATTHSYDLILMDISMPRMDGFEASRRIRASAGPNADTVIAALSAHALTNDDPRLVAAGVSQSLPKPFRRDALEDLLASVDTGAASPQLSTEPVDLLDEQTLGPLTELVGEAAMANILNVFLTSTVEIMNALDQAVERNDVAAWQRGAHTLRGVAGNMGAHKVSQHAQALEDAPDQAAARAAMRDASAALRDVTPVLTRRFAA